MGILVGMHRGVMTVSTGRVHHRRGWKSKGPVVHVVSRLNPGIGLVTGAGRCRLSSFLSRLCLAAGARGATSHDPDRAGPTSVRGVPTDLPGSPGRRLALYAGVAALGRSGTIAMPSAILLAIIAVGDSPSRGSVLIATISAVGALTGPILGAMIDRMAHPRQGFLAGLGAMALGAALLAFGIGVWPLGVLLVIAVFTGLAQPILIGAWSGQLRRVVPDVPSARAYAVDAGTYNIAEIAGPALVGAAFIVDAAFPGSITLEVACVLFVLSMILLRFVPVPPRAVTTDEPPEPLGRTLRRLRIMIDSISLRRNTIIGTFSYGAIAFIVIATPLLGEDLAGDAGVGVFLLTLIAVGAIIGSILLTRRPIVWRGPGTVAIGATALLALVMLGIAAAPNFWVAGAIGVLAGVLVATQVTSLFRVRDRESPPHARGMVFVASASLRTGAFALGSILAGALAFAGWRWLIVGAAAVEVLAVILALLSAPVRRPTRPVPTDRRTGDEHPHNQR